MTFLIYSFHLIIYFALGLYLYYWSATFKKLAISTREELNEGAKPDDIIAGEKETQIINRISHVLFILMGISIWTILGTTAGSIAGQIATDNILKWFIYFIMYFGILRFSFGVGNKMLKRTYDFKRINEKIFFSITMIGSYILSISYYEHLPDFLTFHLYFLE